MCYKLIEHGPCWGLWSGNVNPLPHIFPLRCSLSRPCVIPPNPSLPRAFLLPSLLIVKVQACAESKKCKLPRTNHTQAHTPLVAGPLQLCALVKPSTTVYQTPSLPVHTLALHHVLPNRSPGYVILSSQCTDAAHHLQGNVNMVRQRLGTDAV